MLDAAIVLFSSRGPAAVALRDVATEAGVNYGLIHRHFGTKDALVTRVVDDLSAALAEGVAMAAATSTAARSPVFVGEQYVASSPICPRERGRRHTSTGTTRP
ncbi:MAG: helix-turn-helix domain-containing protein [Acidimicrobiia bacterium]|nr:helix-turn-helix domain-containing protein [Acidimicrobiia bacterium]